MLKVVINQISGTVDQNRIHINEYEIFSPRLPTPLEGYRMCQVSDAHITGEPRNRAAVARAIQSVSADLFLWTGDLIHRQSGIDSFLRWFDEMGDHVRFSLAVPGNAEHKTNVRKEQLYSALVERKVRVLQNESVVWDRGDRRIQIVGVDDPHTYHSDFTEAYRNADPDLWTVLMCHSPDGARERGGRRADLMLCGHTHGGAIRIPPVGALVHGTTHVRGLVAGWYYGAKLARRSGQPSDDTLLYVSRGLGMSSWKWRFCCPPELPVFTLRHGPVLTVKLVSHTIST